MHLLQQDVVDQRKNMNEVGTASSSTVASWSAYATIGILINVTLVSTVKILHIVIMIHT